LPRIALRWPRGAGAFFVGFAGFARLIALKRRFAPASEARR